MTNTTNLLKTVIRINSVSGNETKIIRFIFDWLSKLGAEPIMVGGNVVCKVNGESSHASLIFNAHVDTVSAGELELWHQSPFSAYQQGEKVYGLGASDEKAGVVSLLLLVEKLLKRKPACDVWFQFVIQEELDGNGTRAVMDWFMAKQAYSHSAAILVEPTGLAEVEIGHKGNVFLKLVTTGSGGHGSQPPHPDQNSVLVMGKVLMSLQELQKNWQKKYQHLVLGFPTIGVGTSITAGDAHCPNKFADWCTATIDIRTTPEMHNKTMDLIKTQLKEYPVEINYLSQPAPFGLTDKNDRLVQAITHCVPEAKICISPGSTDQCFFTQHQIPAIVYGPGEKSVMHQPNEWCDVSKVDQAVAVFLNLIQTWTTSL